MDWNQPFEKFAIPDGSGQMYQTMIAIARMSGDSDPAKKWVEEQVQKFRWRPGDDTPTEGELDQMVKDAMADD
jgi:hypothetical protein